MIPSVRTWKVSFYSGSDLITTEYVKTINKRFAYWFANEQSGYVAIDPELNCTKVTVSLAKTVKGGS